MSGGSPATARINPFLPFPPIPIPLFWVAHGKGFAGDSRGSGMGAGGPRRRLGGGVARSGLEWIFEFFFFPRIWKPQGWTSPFLRTAGQTVGSWRSWGLGRSSLGEVGGAVLGIVPTSILTLGDHLFFGFFFPGVCLGPLEQV